MTSTEFRSALKSLGLRQRKLAGALGVHVSTVSHWAKGHAPVPRYAALCVSLMEQLVEHGVEPDLADQL